MLRNITRSKPIQVWFAAIVLIVVACVAMGVSMTVGRGATLLALSLIPLTIVLMLWPGVQSQTAADVLRGGDQRD